MAKGLEEASNIDNRDRLNCGACGRWETCYARVGRAQHERSEFKHRRPSPASEKEAMAKLKEIYRLAANNQAAVDDIIATDHLEEVGTIRQILPWEAESASALGYAFTAQASGTVDETQNNLAGEVSIHRCTLAN
ncbi:MAG: hypothetical protein ACI81P_001523 [Neolewinella sp.]|jgi:hypothetical protein